MRHKNPSALLLKVTVSFFIFLNSYLIHASTVLQMDVDDLLDKAEFIFEGQVINSESTWNQNRTSINTHITFRIIDTIKGNHNQENLTLIFAGGTVDGLTLNVSGMVYPKVGEKGIYFVENLNGQQVNPLLGWTQGLFRVSNDDNGEERITTENKTPVIGLTQDQEPETNSERRPSSVLQSHSHTHEENSTAHSHSHTHTGENTTSHAPFISEGIADGLNLGNQRQPLEQAIKKNAFKDALKARMNKLNTTEDE